LPMPMAFSHGVESCHYHRHFHKEQWCIGDDRIERNREQIRR
jgi:hypothetical protein